MSQPQDRWAWAPLGQMLVNDKVLTTDQLNQALERQRKTRERYPGARAIRPARDEKRSQ